MELLGGRYTCLVFIVTIQILYASMDTSVDCRSRDHPKHPAGTKPTMLPPIGIPGGNYGTSKSKYGPEGIIGAPCPSGMKADENGSCRQRLD